ncbi:hypothetical protein KDL01_03150 [Actinospica durhamensis]|uniref:Uncharacterized protein n=1 Tax=Actinospica durhamensis TaxID=1508375 RepID=A0A941EJY6_9ACTN|nr:hypothetical protein [Actinospica durhamensis]MBR7832238.1 hypothetical protein [Actinospica durhamensis]
MDFDNLLGEQLSSIADDAAPVGTIDPHRAIGQAQRIRLRRRTAGAGTTLAVLGLATGLGFTLTGGAAAIAPATSTGMGLTSSAAPTEHRSVAGTDPLTVDGYFGKLASPLVATSVSVSDSGLQQIEATDESTSTVFTVTLLDSGPDPAMGYPRAPDVNGDTAYWDEAGSLGHLSGVPNGLSWRYSPNGWADLMFDQATASKTELAEIADAVHFGSTAVRMPIALPTAAGFTLGKAASLTFNADGSLKQATITLRAPASTSILTIAVYPAGSVPAGGTVAKCAFPSTGTASSPETTTFLGEDCDGLFVDAYLNSHDPATVAAAASLLNGAVWYGTNPEDWTVNVYR